MKKVAVNIYFKIITVKSCLHSFIIVVRHSWAAFCSNSSRASGTPMFLRGRLGLGLPVADLVPLRLKSDGAKHTARLLAVIWCSDAFWDISARK